MLRTTALAMGRWTSRDFMRGRSKMHGQVHTRHTLGSRGRMKRWGNKHGLRDVGGNHPTKGLLGIRLGAGGLFGARVSNKELKQIESAEDLDTALHGAPDILNPYRAAPEEHPDIAELRRACGSITPHVVFAAPPHCRGRAEAGFEAALRHLAADDAPCVPVTVARRFESVSFESTDLRDVLAAPADESSTEAPPSPHSAVLVPEVYTQLAAPPPGPSEPSAAEEAEHSNDGDDDSVAKVAEEECISGGLRDVVGQLSAAPSVLRLLMAPVVGDGGEAAPVRDALRHFVYNKDPRTHVRDSGVGHKARVRVLIVAPVLPLPPAVKDSLVRQGFLAVQESPVAAITAAEEFFSR